MIPLLEKYSDYRLSSYHRSTVDDGFKNRHSFDEGVLCVFNTDEYCMLSIIITI